jgi:hypothetical protein
VGGLDLTPLDEGVIVGLLIGQGNFGGDGRKPQVTLRMHVRHEALLRWLQARVPRSRLYGPYDHGDRCYFQWMVRGPALVEDLLPVLERHIQPELDAHAHERLMGMIARYGHVIERARRRAARAAADASEATGASAAIGAFGATGASAATEAFGATEASAATGASAARGTSHATETSAT